MDFLTLAKDRYSVRKFSDKPIEPDEIDKILEAGRLAPTAVNFQPQRILVINSEEALGKMKKCTKFHFDAPAAMLVCYDKSVSWKRRFDGKDSGEIDASIVTTHMMMEATQIGIGTTWVMYYDPIMIKDLFRIPDHIEPVALLVMGYPAKDATMAESHLKYESMEKTVCYNDFSL